MMKEYDYSSIAISILNWNNYEDTIDCINSLLAINLISQKQIFLIDNNSKKDPTQQFLRHFPDINYYRLENNIGYSKGCNFAIKKIMEKKYIYILLINNDTIVTKNFLDYLIDVFSFYTNVAIVVPKVKMFSNPHKLYHAGGTFNKYSGRAQMYGFNKKDNDKYSKLKEIDFANGCCMLVKKEVFEKLGLFDEKFFFYGEDADFSIRVKKYGYKIIFSPSSVIFHKFDVSQKARKSEYYLFHSFRSIGFIFRMQLKNKFSIVQLIYFFFSISYNVIKRILKWNFYGAISIIFGFFNLKYKRVDEWISN